MNQQQELLKEAKKSETREAIKAWKLLVDNPSFQTILRLIERRKGVYSESMPENTLPHIQSERNGGTKGWNLYRKNLSTLCNDERFISEITEIEEAYNEDGYSDHVEE